MGRGHVAGRSPSGPRISGALGGYGPLLARGRHPPGRARQQDGDQGPAGARRPDEGPLRGAIGLPVGSGLLGLPLAFWAISARGGPSPGRLAPGTGLRAPLDGLSRPFGDCRPPALAREANPPRPQLGGRFPSERVWLWAPPRLRSPGAFRSLPNHPPSHLLPTAPVHASKIHDLSDTTTLDPAGYRALQSRGPRSRVARAEHPGGGLAKGRAGHPRSPPSPLLSADHLLANGSFQGNPPGGG
jgi:hypothetical protein